MRRLPPEGKAVNATVFVWFWALTALIAAFVTSTSYVSHRYLAVQALALLVAGIYTTSRLTVMGFWSPVSVFLLVVGLFHLGLAPYWIFGIDPGFIRTQEVWWFQNAAGQNALRLVSFGIIAYSLSAVLYVAVHKRKAPSRVILGESQSGRDYATWGAVLLVTGCLAWFGVVAASGGTSLLRASYRTFLERTETSPLPYVYMAIGVGLGLTVMNYRLAVSRVGLSLFALYAFFAFFIGLRGEVLFPLAVAASVLGMHRNLTGPVRTLSISVIALLMIDLVKQVRQTGWGAANFDLFAASPFRSLAELGSTIGVVATVSDWHDDQGEPFRLGATYAVSVVRSIEAAMGQRPPAAEDFRLFNVEIASRAGNVGGSIVGEGYHNFGVIGVLVVFALMGWFFTAHSMRGLSATRIAIYVCIAVPLFNHIRNSFVPVLPSIAAGFTYLACILISSGFSAHYRSGPKRHYTEQDGRPKRKFSAGRSS